LFPWGILAGESCQSAETAKELWEARAKTPTPNAHRTKRGIMKGYAVLALIVLGISMFCGIIVIAVGFGSIFTPLNQIAGPVVCGSQQLQIVQRTYSYRPGQTNWDIMAYCVDPAAETKRDVTGAVQLVSGGIYGLILFVLLFAWLARLVLTTKDTGKPTRQSKARPQTNVVRTRNDESSESIEARLKELKELRDADLITDQDFEDKKAELLREL
jgi:hypothetical protein